MTWTLIIIIWFGGNVYHTPQVVKIDGFSSFINCFKGGETIRRQMVTDGLVIKGATCVEVK